VNQVVADSDQAQTAFANLWYYVPAFQQFTFFTFRTWITGMQNELNPTLGGVDLLYNLITKPSTTTASSVGGMGYTVGIPTTTVTFAAPFLRMSLGLFASRVFERAW
jgi:hypothetical protein